jgi:DNA anti-recombination protein RmuC
VYIDGMKKLTEGRGNLVTSVEKLRLLGLKNSKVQNPALLDRALAQEIDLNETTELPDTDA